MEDRRPTCVFAIFPDSTPCPQSASLPSLEGPLTALDWLTGCLQDSGGRADWRVRLDCDVRPSGPLQSALSTTTNNNSSTVRSSDNKLQAPQLFKL